MKKISNKLYAMPSTKPSKVKKKKRKKLTPEQKEKNEYRQEVRVIFSKAGFKRIPKISDVEFTFLNIYTSDFDDVFVNENIIIFTEYTLTKAENISSHLKPKKTVYDAILGNKKKFLEYLFQKFPILKEQIDDIYPPSKIQIRILYCAKNDVESVHKKIVPDIFYLDYPVLKYFKATTESVKKSARFEIFKFFGLEFKEIGKNCLDQTLPKNDIRATVLPETHSNFKKGYKVVSFYIDPERLLTHSYVLRKDGWRDEGEVYQRMIISKKIIAIRRYLLREERVFINNIIVTLPSQTKIKDENGDTVNIGDIDDTIQVTLEIPQAFNTIGLIDGQHRVFAYHEGGEQDDQIGKMRKKQNLLVTGIIYPRNIEETEKIKFEAQLFLEINSNQANAKSDLKQAIGLILNPFTTESISKSLINKLNYKGPLANKFQKHFYEKDKIKTTSIVSYGLKPIMKLSGTDSLFFVWKNKNKSNLTNKDDPKLLSEYLDFAATELNIFLSAVKAVVGPEMWTTDHAKKKRILSTTVVNGLIICFRKVIGAGKLSDFESYRLILNGLDKFHFENFKSSQYGKMGNALYLKFFP